MNSSLTIRQQVAQRMICGYQGLNWQSGENIWLQRLLSEGLGGVILFRENLQAVAQSGPDPMETGIPQAEYLSPTEIAQSNWMLQQHRPATVPPLFISIDQEGGQVERIPFKAFPSSLSPLTYSHSQKPTLAYEAHRLMGQYLRAYGFNLNYSPTLDVNLNRHNPIIGVRAFGNDPTTVWEHGKQALQAYHDTGILSCIKHFPGHGHGQVDSHVELPTLTFTHSEQYPFIQALQSQFSQRNEMLVMVNHGYYPALQGKAGEGKIPASASRYIIQNLLRTQYHFEGLIITDDMEMGGISQVWNPVEAALKCIEAGVDILLYRQSGEVEWQIFEALVHGLENGSLSIEAHNQTLNRILQAKKHITPITPPKQTWLEQEASEERCQKISLELATKALETQPQPAQYIQQAKNILLVHPQRNGIRNYSYDQPLSPELPSYFEQYLPNSHTHSLTYPLLTSEETDPIHFPDNPPDWLIFVAFNSRRFNSQIQLWESLKQHYKNQHTQFILISAGMDDDAQLMTGAHWHIPLCGYRPHQMKALALRLASL